MLKRTPLFETHRQHGARLVEFGGWEMPVQYTSIMDEHQTVRTASGMFDISHMGEFMVSGPRAAEFLNRALTNDIRKLAVGDGQYTLMCNPSGGVVDDLYAYRLGQERFLLIVNASRIDADFTWLEAQAHAFGAAVRLENLSESFGAVAVQGPKTSLFIDAAFPANAAGLAPSSLKKNQIGTFSFQGAEIWIGRTGYTGEDGFEIVAPANLIVGVWEAVMAAGTPFGLKPAGLGARDTLRTEMCYPLYGHELDENTTPIEAGVGFFVALEKGDFVGRAKLLDQKQNGAAKKCVAFKMTDKSAPPRPHYPIWGSSEAGPIGEVVSGTLSPSLGIGIGMGYVPPEAAKPGATLQIEIRGRKFPAVIVPKPIYRKTS